ncbi:MAG: ABC transporter permease [Armatimonadetes bacterium]|nr:ABC transporter permease [Armatimonadota bacterium]
MNAIKLVLFKEVREMLRDRRVVMGAFVVPLLVMYLITNMFGFIGNSISDKKNTAVYVVANKNYEQFITALKALPETSVTEVQSEAEGRDLLSEGKAKALVIFPSGALDPNAKQISVRTLYTSDQTISMIALSKVQAWAEAANKAALQLILKQENISAESAEPIKIDREDTAKTKGAGESPIVGMVPYLLILFVFSGGMSIAADLVAGEKERGTMETLLITPVSRVHIALGKFLSLLGFSLTSTLVSITALFFFGSTNATSKKLLYPEGYSLGFVPIASILLVVLSLATFFAAIQLLTSVFARNMREAQTYLALLNFAVIIPAAFSQLLGLTDVGREMWVRFVPVLNSAVSMRETLLGNFNPLGSTLTVIFNLVLSLACLVAAVRYFTSEKVLAKS